jgi:glycosyltransferase involved in cell wall biosynthesis
MILVEEIRMLSVIIATLDCERTLVPTLATLVPGAAAGTVRDVIVTDGGSRDDTLEVADIAGCEIIRSQASLGVRLREATARARASWVMYLRPGAVLDSTWVDEVGRFVQQGEAQGVLDAPAAVFRRMSRPGVGSSVLGEALSSLWMALSTRPIPEQGLVIPKVLYDRIGRHRDVADPEMDLINRIGRRRIARLGSGIWRPADS